MRATVVGPTVLRCALAFLIGLRAANGGPGQHKFSGQAAGGGQAGIGFGGRQGRPWGFLRFREETVCWFRGALAQARLEGGRGWERSGRGVGG